MLQLKLGIELASLKLPLKKGLLMARDLRAEAVEIDLRRELSPGDLSQTGIRQVRKMLEDLNLRISAVTFRTRRGYDVAADLEARVDATKRAMRQAYELGTGIVINHIGRVPADSDQAGSQLLVEVLSDLGRYSQRVGAILAAETGTESGEAMAGLIARLPPGSLGVDFNPASLILHGHEPREAIGALGPHVVHFHATDATREAAVGRGLEVPLGQGNAELPELLAVLEEQQYRGYITVARHDSASPLADIQQALTFLRNL
jgi:sugar phosphate isomerase/epimerase